MPELAQQRSESAQSKNANKQVRIEYFALLKEERGASCDQLKTVADTARELYAELKARHGFSLSFEHLSVAINDEFAQWTSPIHEGDKVVFIPPVAGG